MNSARKYQDRDVRANPDLLAEAVRYARHYDGEFDFLVAAAELVHATGTLPVAVARGVLNCMRVDPREAVALPEPSSEDATVTPIRKKRPPSPKRIEPRETMTIPARLKTPYGVARQNGSVLHRVREAEITWSRREYPTRLRKGRLLPQLQPVRLYVQWVCSSSWSGTWNPHLYRASELAPLAARIPYCRSGCWAEEGESG